ncbi:MAG TPA: hypothetical protein VJX67_19935, partial [Blastocatellia bacterium]|nr:hypothetical protein [Blastocatellia bacterium]
MEKRLVVIMAFASMWVAAIGFRLVRLQVRDHDVLKEHAEHQQQAPIEVSPIRGLIFDRDGRELARSVTVKSLYAVPARISNAGALADKLSVLLDMDRDPLFKRLTSGIGLVVVKRKLTDREVADVQALGLPAAELQFIDEQKRFYVNGSSASQVLGFVDIDERGQSGVEQSLDRMVRGRGARVIEDVDALKKPYDQEDDGSVPGDNVTLTIDTVLQSDIEQALADAVKANGAKAGTVVIVRPATGEILAMASYPTFNPNDVARSS